MNIGLNLRPARTHKVVLERRNEVTEWGLEVTGGWSEEGGSWLQVARVRPGSPADNAGLRGGDMLISINGQMVVFSTQYEAEKSLENGRRSVSIEFERKVGRSDIQTRRISTLVLTKPEPIVKDIVHNRYSIYAPKNILRNIN